MTNNIAQKLKSKRELYEEAGFATPVKKRKKTESLLEKLRILKKKKKKN